jgi:hypothetical protein
MKEEWSKVSSQYIAVKVTCLRDGNTNRKSLALHIGDCAMGWKTVHIKNYTLKSYEKYKGWIL